MSATPAGVLHRKQHPFFLNIVSCCRMFHEKFHVSRGSADQTKYYWYTPSSPRFFPCPMRKRQTKLCSILSNNNIQPTTSKCQKLLRARTGVLPRAQLQQLQNALTTAVSRRALRACAWVASAALNIRTSTAVYHRAAKA